MIGEDLWNGRAYLDVLDFSNPTEPRRISRYSEWVGGNSRVAVSDNYAFIAGECCLQVIDVSDPARMTRIGSAFLTESREQVLVEDIVGRQSEVLVTIRDRGLATFQMPPFIKSITRDGPNVKLDWEGFGPARLQRATRLANPDWLDLIGSENTNRVTLPMRAGPEFFRLVKP